MLTRCYDASRLACNCEFVCLCNEAVTSLGYEPNNKDDLRTVNWKLCGRKGSRRNIWACAWMN